MKNLDHGAVAWQVKSVSPASVVASDPVNHPAHYTHGRIEVIEAIEDWKLGFHEGNAVKYIARAAHKGNRKQDLEKAAWYLDRLLAQLSTEPAGLTARTKATEDLSRGLSQTVGQGHAAKLKRGD